MIDSEFEDEGTPVGRWATLNDAARIYELSPDKLLKKLKSGAIRGTQMGNNWFAYIDPEIDPRRKPSKRQAQKGNSKKAPGKKQAQIDFLQAEKEALEEERIRLIGEAGLADEKLDRFTAALKPLIDQLKQHHEGLRDEVKFLREEMRAMRQQHAEEMRRKDILLRQTYQLLSDQRGPRRDSDYDSD
ncbi:MAG: hypothetical protein R3360_01915 [Alphaproteobacteria bacterium]|nr:hypothetical protein [Alphaproteobacteria bacterium]